MKFSIRLQIKVFMIVIGFIVVGQMVYSIKNVNSFRKSYLASLREKSRTSGELLKNDVEFVLNLNLPLTKLVNLEKTLEEILKTTPELEFIEITDLSDDVLYYADHNSIGRLKPGTQRSRTLSEEANQKLHHFDLNPNITDTIIPVYFLKKNQMVGYIKMRLFPELIANRTQEILLDMITVILTSLLITFELLSFFVTYSISNPLKNTVHAIRRSLKFSSCLPEKSYVFMETLNKIVKQFNDFMKRFSATLNPFFSIQHHFIKSQGQLKFILQKQSEEVNALNSELFAPKNSPLKAGLERMYLALGTFQERLELFIRHVSPETLSRIPQALIDNTPEEETEQHLPYVYIRLIIFFFIMADSLAVSFFPLYVNILYRPVLGLSKEVIIGLPISIFMFSYAISMPFTGGWSDRSGWYKPLLMGIFLDAIGLILTAMAQDILHLILARIVTAIGFGMGVMASQQFIINNTTLRNRTLGMASYITAFFGGDICGTVIGGMLADRIGYRNVFLVSGLLSLFALMCVVLLFRKEFHKTNTSARRVNVPLKHIIRAVKDMEFLSITLLQAIPAKVVLIGFLYYLIPLYLKRLGILQSNIGRVIMCYSLMLIFLSPLFSKIFHNESHKKYYIVIGGLITGFSLVSFYFFSGFVVTLILVCLLGVAHTFSVSSQASYITETATFKKLGTGTGMGIFRSFERGGSVVGPLLTGLLITRTSYEQAVAFLGVGSIMCSVLYLFLIITRRKKS